MGDASAAVSGACDARGSEAKAEMDIEHSAIHSSHSAARDAMQDNEYARYT